MSTETREQSVYAKTYGGVFGGMMPVLAMIIGIIILSALGLRSTVNLWSAGYLAVIAGFFVYKDKSRFQSALLGGIKDHVFAFIIACLLFTGVLSKILTAAHLVDSMLWVASMLNFSPAYLPVTCFILGVILSSATGSAAGTMSTLAPIMLPLANAMGCDINLVCGSILSGAAFGDNLAPISDTTIASSLTQEVSVIKVVRSRMKYSLVGGAAAAAAFIIAGMSTVNASGASSLAVDSSYASSLIFLILPALVVIMMLKKANFFTAVFITSLLGLVMLLLFGYVDFIGLTAKDGLIVSAFSGNLNAIIFMMFIFMAVNLVKEAGVLDALMKKILKYAKSEQSAEIASGAMVCITSIVIGSGTSAITFCGPIIRSLLRPFKIDRARAANFLDGLGCGTGYLIPYNAGCMVLASLAVSAGVATDGYSPISFVGYNFYSMALIVVYWFAIFSGWGRRHETEEELRADGVIIDQPLAEEF